ncbi:hypothetical protein CFP65_7008 [Kitasatospora sp. MMS16-BH015]|uniref:PRC-barrel domain-containing protein n=1 Tax=Kitasatospora sp. MMS16-BH015 TaxID=2018025 RepID=UPI000CA3C55C|nr:PRC-barrel domain-containing protein [Kitasatospora sp. MMS16-BH015]AUG81617.1 hypothetical protein CFP65_7008 [Kitasatospora sp. MMS16-BH015]
MSGSTKGDSVENIMWEYQENSGHWAGADLTGYKVEASDGHIGKVDKHSEDVDARYIVVDTGPWIFGKHVLLPAGTVASIDTANETIHVSRTKEEIKNSPEFDKDKHTGDADYHQRVGSYYSDSRTGY